MKKICFLLISFLLVFNACKKETGPQGTTGPTGNANVISTIDTAYTYDWQAVTSTNNATYENVTFTDLNITQDILNNGVVLVYMQPSGDTYWEALPMTQSNGNLDNVMFGYYFVYEINSITITWYRSDGADPGPRTINFYFKIIVIPATAMSEALITHPNLDLKNYEEVMKTFNVHEISRKP